MKTPTKVVIGVPLYNRADYLPEALESLLSQTYRDFALVLVDDCSTDDTPKVVAKYAAIDPRIHFERNPERLGMIGNWRKAFERARERHPTMQYFAWASDHDVWHPRWLATLLPELERHPELVLTYPHNVRISESGETIQGPWTFDTFGETDPWRRLGLVTRGMSAGNMIYGLFRADVIERAGIFRFVLAPDRLLLTEAALYGQFEQVPEVLWSRRFVGLVSAQRQRASFFPNGNPAYSYLPWSVMHAGVLAWALGLRGAGQPDIGTLSGLRVAYTYLPPAAKVEWRSYLRRTRKRLSQSMVGRLVRRVRDMARGVRDTARGVAQQRVTLTKRANRVGKFVRKVHRRTSRPLGRRVVRRARLILGGSPPQPAR